MHRKNIKKNCTQYKQTLIYTVSRIKYPTYCLIITSANVDRFSKFFHQVIRKKIVYVHTQRFPPHLQYVATLPCEILNPKILLILKATTRNCWHFLCGPRNKGEWWIRQKCAFVPTTAASHLRALWGFFCPSSTQSKQNNSASRTRDPGIHITWSVVA